MQKMEVNAGVVFTELQASGLPSDKGSNVL